MSRAHRFGRRFAAITALVWVAGLLGIWWWLPPSSRDGWQLPLGQRVLGFLSDGRTLVTVPQSSLKIGPICLWDVESGQSHAEYLGSDEGLEAIVRLAGGDLIQVQERAAGSEKSEHHFSLRLIDAWTGKDVARFSRHAPDDGIWWFVSPDGRTTAFVTRDEKEQPRLECYDVASGKLLHATAGYHGGFFYTPDGRGLVAIKEGRERQPSGPLTITILDAASGHEITTFPQVPRGRWLLSPRGDLLLDSSGACWDAASTRRRFNAPSDLRGASYAFTPEGESLIALSQFGQQRWLTYYRADDGEEQVERAAMLGGAEPLLLEGAVNLGLATSDGRLLSVEGTLGKRPRGVPTLTEMIRAFLPGSNQPAPPDSAPRPQHVCVLIEADTGREVARLDGQFPCFSPDGRFAITTNPDGVYQLWDVPPRRSRWAFFFWGGIWTAAIALVALRRAVNVSRHAKANC